MVEEDDEMRSFFQRQEQRCWGSAEIGRQMRILEVKKRRLEIEILRSGCARSSSAKIKKIRNHLSLLGQSASQVWVSVQMFNFSTLSILAEVRLNFKFIKGHRNLFGQQIPHGSPYFWQYKSIQMSSKSWNVEIHQVYYSGVGTLKLTSPVFCLR